MKTDTTWKESVTLIGYIRILLKDGKRANHPDFEILYRLYGKDRIVQLAIEEKKKLVEEEKNE